MKAIFFSLFGLLAVAISGSAVDDSAETKVAVLELFTSQGCPSCPPADAIVRELRDQPNIILLSWPVDYWDRMGWEDTAAKPQNAKRQAAYNKRMGISGVFTPQLIINGNHQSVGSEKLAVEALVDNALKAGSAVYKPSLTPMEGGLRIELGNAATPLNATIHIIFYRRDLNVQITSGENGGRTLHYSNVVRFNRVAGEWTGAAETYLMPLDKSKIGDADHVVVLLQNQYRHGTIIGAAEIALPAIKDD